MPTRSSPIKYRPTVWDALIAAAIIALGLLAAVLFYTKNARGGSAIVTVSVAGEVAERAALSQFDGDHVYTGNGYTLTVSAHDGEIFVSHSDCGGQDCVHTGAISRIGQSIVCLPAQIVIRLESASPGDADVIVG
ncbi:MAG: NusG domain II-containing protein [Oscillospiraceae bacterium]|nr:NusG domain II-containing protein [Oscillospiraceae bacterium]